jgi:hypothetical protein
MSRIVLWCALVATLALAAAIATPVARADRGQKVGPPTLLWKSYPLVPRTKRTVNAEPQPKAATPPEPQPKTATPPEPRQKAFVPPMPRPKAKPTKPRPKATAQTKSRRKAASYQISTHRTGTSSLLLLAVFLGGLLAVAATMLVGWKLLPTGDRRRRRLTEAAVGGTDDGLLKALRPTPSPKPLPKLVVAQGASTVPGREPARPSTHRAEATVARCEIKLWRGFAKSHLYAAQAGLDEEPIAFSSYFRLLEDDRSSSEGLQALAALVEDLEQDGWTVVSDGPAWYEHRLERPERS